MGKTRKTKRHVPKVNPLGIPTNRDVDEDVELYGVDTHPEGPIQAMFEQLQSVSVEEKMNALQALALMSASIEKARIICASEIIRVAAPLLVDSNQSLRNATAGALRNLSVCGVEICEILVEQDVLTPLLALLNEYANSVWIPSFDRTMNNQLDEKSDTFLQAINLLWNLCESTSSALENFNQAQIVHSLIRCLDVNVFGLDISIAVAQCLLVISEDNANCWNILNNFVEEFLCLLRLDGSVSHAFLRSLAAGILSNVPALAAAHSLKILEALAKTLDLNHRHELSAVTSRLPLLEEQNPVIDVSDNPNAMEDETDEAATRRRRLQELPSEIELEVLNIERLLEAQRVAAETITNICSSDDDEWVDDESDKNSDAESVHDYETSNNGSSTNLQNTDKLPVEILEAIKSLGLIEKLWQRAQPIPENVYLILQESSTRLSKKVRGLRLSALLCLQNLCNIMTTEDLGGPEAIYGVWLDLGQQVFQGPNDIVILEPATSLMRASLEHLKHSPDLFKQMTLNDLDLILNGVKSCSEAEIRANWLRMLGILGCLLPENLVKVIINFILDTCLKENEVWTISEAADALMDMFSDNDWEQVSYEVNLLKKCIELEKKFKTKMRQQKRDLKDRYPAVMTVRTNFSRFLKYIEGQMKNYKPPQRVS